MNTGRTHRKAREITHLSTVHSGEDLPPRANSTPCGNRTHDLLAVRQQCKQLSHRATRGGLAIGPAHSAHQTALPSNIAGTYVILCYTEHILLNLFPKAI